MLNSRIFYLPRPSRLSGYIRSRLRVPDIDDVTIKKVIACYGLELTTTPRNLPNTRRNQNLILNTSKGKKILKRYRSDWRISTIVYEHSILSRLAQLNFPAPRLVPALNHGETYNTQPDGYYALFDFLNGNNYSTCFLVRSQRLKLMELAGQTLAKLHRTLDGFLPEGQHHLGFKSFTAGRHRDIAWHVRKVDELQTKSGSLKAPQEELYARWLVNHRHSYLEELSQLDELLSKASLPRLIIHGDYGLHNLLFIESGRITPVDFELARLEWRLSDLVSCLSRFRFSNEQYDFESLSWFIKGYQTEYPIGDEEWSFFPQVWRFYKIMGAIQYWSSYFETNGPLRKLISACDAIWQAEWVKSHPKQILDLKTD